MALNSKCTYNYVANRGMQGEFRITADEMNRWYGYNAMFVIWQYVDVYAGIIGFMVYRGEWIDDGLLCGGKVRLDQNDRFTLLVLNGSTRMASEEIMEGTPIYLGWVFRHLQDIVADVEVNRMLGKYSEG